MGNAEHEAPLKSDRSSLQLQEQLNVHPYSEWTAMQAYYGPGVGMPPPYFSSGVISGHATHPYMWSHQPMMPFGAPFHPMYSHAGGYPHPSLSIGSPAQGHGSTSSSITSEAVVLQMETSQNAELPSKSSTNSKEHGLMKKLKGFDGLAVSPNNPNAEEARILANKPPQSGEEGGTDGSCDGTNSHDENDMQRKRICFEEAPGNGKNGKIDMQCSSDDASATKISLSVSLGHQSVTGKSIEVAPLNSASGAEVGVSRSAKSRTVASIPLPNTVTVPVRDGVLSEHWLQDERELKRERRKQSNRESARRSRLRKQAETEELALKVEKLSAENVALKTELSRLNEISENLRLEKSALMEKLENPTEDDLVRASCTSETEEPPTLGLANLLSRVNNSSSNEEHQEKSSEEGSDAKLHQLLEPSSRTDALAAG